MLQTTPHEALPPSSIAVGSGGLPGVCNAVPVKGTETSSCMGRVTLGQREGSLALTLMLGS